MYYGDFPEDATVRIPFNTFSSDDPSASCTITNLVDGDIKVHKDGAVGEIATDGATITINFDGITGNHLITIDTSVDAAYTVGSDYLVRINGTTVDGATINAWIGSFSIENRYNPVTDYDGPTNAEMVAAFTEIKGGTWAAGTDTLEHIRNKQTDIEADTAAILIDTDTMEADLKTYLDAIETNLEGDIEANDVLIDTAITNIAAVKAETALIVADTDELQTDDTPTAIAGLDTKIDAVKAETALIVADTNELQTDDIPGTLSTMDTKLNTIAGDVVNIDGDAMRGTDGANTIIPDIAGTAATPAEVATALTDIHLDHLLAADYDPANKPGVVTALLNELVENDAGISRFTTNALEQAPTGGDATEAKQDSIIAAVITNAAGVDIAADIIAVKAETADIVADTNELQVDNYPTALTAIQNKTDNLPADPASETNVNVNETKIDTMQGNVTDILTDTSTTLDTLLDKILAILSHKLTIVDLTGNATLRTLGDGADMATWNITDDDTDTVRTEVTWA